MARAVSAGAILVGLWGLAISTALGTTIARAACIIDTNDEITNPFEHGCGDVILTYTENDNSGNNIALGYPVPFPVASLTPVDGFRDYASLFARHQSLLVDNDEVAGSVVGHTVAGRDIWAYAIADADTQTADGLVEGAVLINGGIHAREWQTPEAVTALFEALVAGKHNGGLEQYLVENLTTVVVPVNNVDGFIQTQLYPDRSTATRDQPREGRMRRKNLRNPGTQSAIDSDIFTIADNFWGVDLNRNAVEGYAQANSSSSSVTSLIYRGAAPESEPELQALYAAAALGPAERLRFFSDTHSFSQTYFAPTTGNARRNAITSELSARMRAASERPYTYSPDPAGSAGIGSMADHFAVTYQIPSWTLEVEPLNGAQDYGGLASHGHSGFVLPAREAARMRTDVTRMYLLGLYRQSGPPAAIAAQIRDAATGEIVYDAHWEATSASARTLSTATNRALVTGRSYRLWVAFNKPMRISDAGGAARAYHGQSTAAQVGSVSLEIPAFASQSIAFGASARWLGTAGGAPDGYLRYAHDAFVAAFTVPASINAATATGAALAMTIQDMAQSALDANPATAADWSGGHWIRYEDAMGVDSDAGGTDCNFKPFIASRADAAAPATNATCTAAVIVNAPPPAPTAPRRSGGGSTGALELAITIALCAARGIRRTRARRDSAG
jgi:Zinc carboxypeptidase